MLFSRHTSNVLHRFSVPHDRLFLDSLEHDLKCERMGLEPTTQIVGPHHHSHTVLQFQEDPRKMVVRVDIYACPGFGAAAAGGYPPGMGMDTGTDGSGGSGGDVVLWGEGIFLAC
jgi:hypothetical protein